MPLNFYTTLNPLKWTGFLNFFSLKVKKTFLVSVKCSCCAQHLTNAINVALYENHMIQALLEV